MMMMKRGCGNKDEVIYTCIYTFTIRFCCLVFVGPIMGLVRNWVSQDILMKIYFFL